MEDEKKPQDPSRPESGDAESEAPTLPSNSQEDPGKVTPAQSASEGSSDTGKSPEEADPGGGGSSAESSPGSETDTESPASKPKAAAKPAAKKPPAKKPAAKKPKGPVFEDLEADPLLEDLKKQFPDTTGQKFLGQRIYTVIQAVLHETLGFLRDEWDFDYLVDVTALDYLGEPERFQMVYHLYSHQRRDLVRVKSKLSEPFHVLSATSLWRTANWLEREVYDMFGIEFEGHPDLKRILLPDDWHGFPLRKDYDIKLQDQEWIKKHLKIRKTPA